MDTAETIAQGGQPAWEQTFDHQEYGKLTFSCKKMPTGADWLRHAAMQEALAPGVTQGTGALLAASAAGMHVGIIEAPVIDRRETVDPDNPDHVKIELIRYDPLEDENVQFPVDVWIAFHRWRAEVLQSKEAVKNSSGATSSAAVVDASPATSESQPTA